MHKAVLSACLATEKSHQLSSLDAAAEVHASFTQQKLQRRHAELIELRQHLWLWL